MESFDQILENSRAFFDDVLLPRIADYLPMSIEVTDEMKRVANRALGAGFTSALMFPSIKRQQLDFHLGVVQLLSEPLEDVSADLQYAAPLVESVDAFKQSQTLNRPEGPYCLFMLSGAYPAETRGKSPNDLRPLFSERGWVSLTAFEYMAIQRVRATRTGDHGFDRKGPMGQPMWLLDTLMKDGGTGYGYWDAASRAVHLASADSDVAQEGFGAHPALVVPIPED
ncbi:hypothetical protein [Iodidimonas sp. SYSU 1G8]|uniref:hypothetical protein n=1 Tax=Iodidimonas sp. SYSU 1G8 TaxID=3133967 RepID=UPI0031FE8009